MEQTKELIQKLEEIHDIILQSIANKHVNALEQSMNKEKEKWTNRLADIIITTGEEIKKNSGYTLDKIIAPLEKHINLIKEQKLIQDDIFIKEIVQNFKDTELLTQKLETAYKATKDFIEQNQQGMSKNEMQELLRENILAQNPSKKEATFLTATIDNALENEYKQTYGVTSNEKSFTHDILSQFTKSPKRDKERISLEQQNLMNKNIKRNNPTNKLRR